MFPFHYLLDVLWLAPIVIKLTSCNKFAVREGEMRIFLEGKFSSEE